MKLDSARHRPHVRLTANDQQTILLQRLVAAKVNIPEVLTEMCRAVAQSDCSHPHSRERAREVLNAMGVEP